MCPETKPKSRESGFQRLRVLVRGAVQGVGFRPFIYRLAKERHLTGWVRNSSQGVSIEVKGGGKELRSFLISIGTEKPPRSSIQSMDSSYLDPVGFDRFDIRESDRNGSKSAIVLPDISTCSDCLGEILDPDNRRYRYPFTNCTNCGPRYSIIESLPYDRPNTTMKSFTMCPECRAEYEDPLDRRFHAQPNACPQCGPKLELWGSDGAIVAERHAALLAAAEANRQHAPVLGGLPAGWRSVPSVPQRKGFVHRGEQLQVEYRRGRAGLELAGPDGAETADRVRVLQVRPDRVLLEQRGLARWFEVARYPGLVCVDSALGPVDLVPTDRFPSRTRSAAAGSLLAPMPGLVLRLGAEVGERVEAGRPLVWLEAMKMEHALVAPAAGVVTVLPVPVGAQVEVGAVLAVLAAGPAAARQVAAEEESR